jgi:hypothetical protein
VARWPHQLDALLSAKNSARAAFMSRLALTDTERQAAYIGEVEVVRDRLKQHRDKEF